MDAFSYQKGIGYGKSKEKNSGKKSSEGETKS